MSSLVLLVHGAISDRFVPDLRQSVSPDTIPFMTSDGSTGFLLHPTRRLGSLHPIAPQMLPVCADLFALCRRHHLSGALIHRQEISSTGTLLESAPPPGHRIIGMAVHLVGPDDFTQARLESAQRLQAFLSHHQGRVATTAHEALVWQRRLGPTPGPHSAPGSAPFLPERDFFHQEDPYFALMLG